MYQILKKNKHLSDGAYRGGSNFVHRVIQGLHSTNEYLQKYNSYLLGLIEKEEFMSYASSIAQGYEEMQPSDIAEAITLIMQCINIQDIDNEYLSDILNVPSRDIQNVRSEMPKVGSMTLKTEFEPVKDIVNVKFY